MSELGTPAKPPTPGETTKPNKQKLSVDQDTFIPPTKTVMSKHRLSMYAGEGRRKSKFGALSSKARMVLGSIVDIKGNAMEFFERKVAKYQNTYRLESEKKFNPEKVYNILRVTMNEVVKHLHYDPEKCANTAKNASLQIKNKVKSLDFDRYKLVCVVSIGEKNSQDVYATCRFLWDADKDRYSFYSLENTYVYAIAYCFGIYYE